MRRQPVSNTRGWLTSWRVRVLMWVRGVAARQERPPPAPKGELNQTVTNCSSYAVDSLDFLLRHIFEDEVPTNRGTSYGSGSCGSADNISAYNHNKVFSLSERTSSRLIVEFLIVKWDIDAIVKSTSPPAK